MTKPAVYDLGRLAGPVLIFGGPYSNLQATRAVLDEAAKLSIPPAHIICTGDVVAYCADPQATVDLIAAAGIPVVQGNCEISLGRGLDDCGCGFDEGSTCDQLSARWYAYAEAHISPEARAWMAGLPARIDFEIAGRRLAVVHGAPSAVNKFVFASTPHAVKAQEIELSGCDGVICGHSGLPFSEIIGGRLWHNAGVIGLPANDGGQHTWYSILWPEAAGLRVEHRTLTYPAQAAADAMRAQGLPAEYSQTLTTGLWDNCDILPPVETEACGRPLTPEPLSWPLAEKITA